MTPINPSGYEKIRRPARRAGLSISNEPQHTAMTTPGHNRNDFREAAPLVGVIVMLLGSRRRTSTVCVARIAMTPRRRL